MKDDTKIKEGKFNMFAAAILVIVIFFIVATALWVYLDALFLALFLFVVLNPIYKFVNSKGIGKTASAFIAMLIGLLVIGIPVVVASELLLQQTIKIMNENNMFSEEFFSNGINSVSGNLDVLDSAFPGMKQSIVNIAAKAASGFINFLASLILGSIANIGEIALAGLVTVFTLFYLMVEQEIYANNLKALFPFNERNANVLFNEFRKILYSGLLCTGLVAVLQAVPLTLVLMYFNIEGAVFWGFIALVLACVPFVGIPFVWIPIAAFQFMNGNTAAGIGIVIAGVLLALIEYIRPLIQKKVGKIHPLITIIGLIVGLANFGVLGLLMGPILLSYALLMIRMFKEEYVL